VTPHHYGLAVPVKEPVQKPNQLDSLDYLN